MGTFWNEILDFSFYFNHFHLLDFLIIIIFIYIFFKETSSFKEGLDFVTNTITDWKRDILLQILSVTERGTFRYKYYQWGKEGHFVTNTVRDWKREILSQILLVTEEGDFVRNTVSDWKKEISLLKMMLLAENGRFHGFIINSKREVSLHRCY